MTNRNRCLIFRTLALAFAAAIGGVATSFFLSKPAPLPVVVPEEKTTKSKPFTFFDSPAEMRQYLCLSSKAYNKVSFNDLPLDRFRFDPSTVVTTVISDQGFLCTVSGRLTRFRQSGVWFNEDKSWTFLLAMTGESEVVSPELASQLQFSLVIRALGSNPVN